mmetsp:Transcript_29501/g.47082  ORF Transcript_29501/g.47082 Transcript_29501/m.47082 type:complete len:200 (+) Transcript_29501:2444-3043(+)
MTLKRTLCEGPIGSLSWVSAKCATYDPAVDGTCRLMLRRIWSPGEMGATSNGRNPLKLPPMHANTIPLGHRTLPLLTTIQLLESSPRGSTVSAAVEEEFGFSETNLAETRRARVRGGDLHLGLWFVGVPDCGHAFTKFSDLCDCPCEGPGPDPDPGPGPEELASPGAPAAGLGVRPGTFKPPAASPSSFFRTHDIVLSD